jgi:hypothetical protein
MLVPPLDGPALLASIDWILHGLELGQTSALRGGLFQYRLLLPQRLRGLDPQAAADGTDRR